MNRRDASGIYEIVNTANGAHYVGSARRLGRRWMEHRKRLRGKRHENAHLQHAWDKYGEDAFVFRVLAVLEVAEVLPTEQRLLRLVVGGKKCYNISLDACAPMAGRSPSAEHRARLAAANRGKRHSEKSKAKTSASMKLALTDEHRAKLLAANIGRQMTPESIAKTAAAHRGRKRSAETCARIAAAATGRKYSAEARAKFSAAQKGRVVSEETRRKLAESKRQSWAAKSPAEREIIAKAGWAARGDWKHSPATKAKIAAGLAAHHAQDKGAA